MDNGYVAPAALKKLRAAGRCCNTVYIYGATGYGKTELVRQYLGSRRYLYLSCEDVSAWNFENLPKEKGRSERNAQRSVVVIDDLHLLRDESYQKEILELLGRDNIWMILISRSQVPAWLVPDCVRMGFIVIREEQLYLGAAETAELFSRHGMELTDEQARLLAEDSRGNPYVLKMALQLMENGCQVGTELHEAGVNVLGDYLENTVFSQWDAEMLEFLMQVSIVEEFTMSLAEMITGNAHVARLLQMAAAAGNFLSEKNGIYRMLPVLQRVLQKRAEVTYGQECVREYAYNAGLYYEMNGQILQALAMYEKSGRDSRIRELLIRNARCNPGNGYYYELSRYYLEMPSKEIESSAILMAAVSMIYSMLMQPEKSEYWYRKLEEYGHTAKGAERKEAKSRLIYLDIALPHRGSKGILHILKLIPALLLDKGISVPEFSVTSNLPSTMNGGKDFCHWSRYDRELAATVGKIVSRVLGRYGKGIVNVALGESLYEKGEDPYEVLTLLTNAEMETMAGGTLEIAFAAIGIRIRLYVVKGDLQTAKMQLDSFERRVREENAFWLLPNIEALRCRLALYEGDKEKIREWMEQAPDENQEFFGLERYRYLTKVRCYLALGDNLKALALLEKCRYYAEAFKRTYTIMEIHLLVAITKQRQGGAWKEELMQALKEACSYNFIRLVSEEGQAATGLLAQVENDCLADDGIDNAWFQRLQTETADMAVRYPLYLKQEVSSSLRFSEKALAILRLQAQGLSIKQIADKLEINPETVKYHTKENYRKLGVSSKTDAVLAARSLKLL